MAKETDIGQGFVINKEKGIMKDGKIIFTQNQLTALIIYYDLCKDIRAQIFAGGLGEVFEDFFKEKSNDQKGYGKPD